ncbi:MAG TPA: dicarboxylate/amino acid:cation symporter [Aquifex aeolicus]|uniref:Dicarboxylate/amino acid:cation symporter n=1 Tax=Aquifex aeolicus TaxID=63363 RepID=A0A9D0YPJ5_AQUAO|nr:dicarboxylate/amino acid:cation symporter [Aquifex aeolicus]HIQ26090.1 dicarboxylate/amino acid:cation symporter [Aquifex aeolicus]
MVGFIRALLDWRKLENQTLYAMVLATTLGLILPDLAQYLKVVGDIFLRLLKAVAIPLVITSIFVSIVSLGSLKELRDLGLKAIAYYTTTTFLAVLTGLIVVNLFFGDNTPAGEVSTVQNFQPKEVSLEDFLVSFFPSNIFQSLAEGKIIQIIVFTILLALGVLAIKETLKGKETVINLFEGLNEAFLNVAGWVIKLTPLGVFAIVYHTVAVQGLDAFSQLWKYALAVVLGLTWHAVVNLGLIAYLLAKVKPHEYFAKVREALFIAFSTASSSATLPVSLRIAQERGGVDKKVAGFVLPLGATVNMDGTALYEAVAVMYIASMYGIDMDLTKQVIVLVTATLAAIGAAGIPSAGLVTMTLVLTAVGLPLEGIAIILAIDRFLDMLRTSVNVWGDLIGAKLISNLQRKRL